MAPSLVILVCHVPPDLMQSSQGSIWDGFLFDRVVCCCCCLVFVFGRIEEGFLVFL